MSDLTFNDTVLDELRNHDTSPDKIATRVAERIATKGFALLPVTSKAGLREGFNWGRSSHGVSQNTLWTVGFLDAEGTEHDVVIVVNVITYTKSNPYDRVPKNNGVPSYRIQAVDATKRVLGWEVGK